LLKEGLISVEGKTRNRKYTLKPIVDSTMIFALAGLSEDVIWRQNVLPLLQEIPDNIKKICAYGFTEMLNNAIDHSDGKTVTVHVKRTQKKIELSILDDGIGIFNKIQKAFGLDDVLHSILELSKGKLTTDPKHHTGEGIFFSSRIFDRFSILSGKLFFSHTSNPNNIDGSDWLIEHKTGSVQGTIIQMEVGLDTQRTTKEVFDHYSDDEPNFSKTHVPVFLAQYGDENLISRSQAKRLLTRFDRFKEIVLDFQNVESIGQAFADEIFRVFKSEHLNINLYPINANEEVMRMIVRAQNVT
jgi:anti-sigma regulatory factor (Ser/Thr protein kinase)